MKDQVSDPSMLKKSIRVAVEGCCHGQLDKIYNSVPKNAELLIICGDFQAIRNQQDLKSMNVPQKYLEMGDFKDYYSGKKNAPVLTIFIGGNHESSSYMRELQYGGWVAPNIYYLGEYGTIWYKGVRISGISGIHNHPSYLAAKSESPPKYTLPYGNSAIRSIYHVKPKNFLKLLLSGYSEIVLSHDWPKGVWEWGNKERLLKKKPFLKADIESGRLGSPLAAKAMTYLRPANWFSSHMHTFFDARVKHENLAVHASTRKDNGEVKRRKLDGNTLENEVKKDINEISLDMDDMEDTTEKSEGNVTQKDQNEISLDMDDMDDPDGGALSMDEVKEKVSSKEPTYSNDSKKPVMKESPESDFQSVKSPSNFKKTDKIRRSAEMQKYASETYFMALDKCLPRRNFLSVISIKADQSHPSFKSKKLYHDARGIAINKVVEEFVRSPSWDLVNVHDMCSPAKMENLLSELNERVEFESSKIKKNIQVPLNWQKVAPDVKTQVVPLQYWPNNQTKEYCEKWGVPEPDLEGH